MAKIALVGYGSRGQGVGKTEQGYAYIVNDNVRTGDKIQPVATSVRGRKFVRTGDKIQPVATSVRGRKFVTTGVVNHSYKQTTAKGQEAKQQYDQNHDPSKTQEITKAYTGKELGATGSRVPKQAGELSQYTQQTRAGNLAMQKQKDPNTVFTEKSQQTFDEYSKQFMPKGE